jgi:hypothetical protein
MHALLLRTLDLFPRIVGLGFSFVCLCLVLYAYVFLIQFAIEGSHAMSGTSSEGSFDIVLESLVRIHRWNPKDHCKAPAISRLSQQ